MIAIGFRSNVEGIGLENAGVELTEHTTIAVDEMMRTNVGNIYAIGDVVAPNGIMLAHVGSAMGIVAAEAIGVEQRLLWAWTPPIINDFMVQTGDPLGNGH